ncbi:MAG TPA: hybrid sensor histidine kinase/response regulator [Geobacter sp.]|nr:hybrid sensor histidine kinase/response regulator [Geobacter sp.]
MAVEVISELLVSSSPQRLGEVLTEHLRELTGARTVMVLAHSDNPSVAHELLNVSPARRAALFTPEELNLFCYRSTPEEIPLLPEELPQGHPLLPPLQRAGIQSMVRYKLCVGGELVGLLLLFDLHTLQRIYETTQAIALLAPPIALALKNAIAFRMIEEQAQELEQRVEERTAELREAQALLQIAVANSPFPTMIHDEEDRVLLLSTGWTRLSGYTIDDIPTLSDWTEKAYGERTGVEKQYIDNLFSIDQTRYNGEWVVTAKDGSKRVWDFQTTPLGRVNKGKRVLLSIATDITESKRAKEETSRLEAQLLQAQKLESIGRLAGGVAHDFNNMLSVILGHANLALMDMEPGDRLQAGLEEIRMAAERSADLTRQLLAFARKQTASPKVLDLNETVGNMLKMLQRLIGERIKLVWKPHAGLWPVLVDPSQIDQILANLCVNSRDCIADIGTITIETGNSLIDESRCAPHEGFAPGEYVRVSISDDGCGMDEETLSHIFEPFFTTKEVGAGTGLGLATVYGVVKQNEGSISVSSRPGIGTTFAIYLPRRHGNAPPPAPEPCALPAARGKETILLVEDEAAILSIVEMMLVRQGYRVLSAHTPGEAIQLAREHSGEIRLLITDVVMPEMNGRDLAKSLLSLYPNLKRLFMSGYTANVIAHHGVLDEGVHFIQKPFSVSEFAAKVRAALE